MKVLGVIPRSKGLVDAMEKPNETNRFVSLRNIRNFEAEIKMPDLTVRTRYPAMVKQETDAQGTNATKDIFLRRDRAWHK